MKSSARPGSSVPRWSRDGRSAGRTRGAVASLVLDRPETRNAVTQAMWEAIPQALAELADARARFGVTPARLRSSTRPGRSNTRPGAVGQGVSAFPERRDPDFPWTHPTQDR